MPTHWPSLRLASRCILAVTATLALLPQHPSCAAAPAPYRPDAYAAVSARIDRLRKQPNCRVLDIGRSVEGRPIRMLVLTDLSHPDEIAGRTRLLLLCGQHGDEPASVDAMLSLAQDLAATRNLRYKSILRRNSILLVPSSNPDGLAHLRRQNGNGVDLNRDWTSPSQPETLAITKIVKTYRPHVIVDEHEWTSATGNKPNCIEVPLVETNLADRLCSLLAVAALSRMSHDGLSLSILRYHPESDQSLAHRHFNIVGVPSMLMETSPYWPHAVRHRTYMDFTMAVLSALSDPPSPVLAERIEKIKSKYADPAHCTIAALCPPKAKKCDYTWYWALLAVAGAYAASLHSSRRTHIHDLVGTPGHAGRSSAYQFEILRSDISTGEKLRSLRARRSPSSTQTGGGTAPALRPPAAKRMAG